MIMKYSEIFKYLDFIKVDNEKNFMTKYINFLILDHCINCCEYIKDIKEKESTFSYLKEYISKQIIILQKDQKDIKNISLKKEDFTFLSDYVFDLFEYKFNQIKRNKKNYLKAYLILISN